MTADNGFTVERTREAGEYLARTADGEWEELVTIEPGPRGLVCVADDRSIPPMLLSAIPVGSLLWRRELWCSAPMREHPAALDVSTGHRLRPDHQCGRRV